MNGQAFATITAAETTRLFTRTSARVGLALCAAMAVGAPSLLGLIARSGMNFNGSDVSTFLDVSGAGGVHWALQGLHSLFLLRAFVILLGALVFAGEYQARTLREDVLRPVPRWSLVFAKWLAMCAYVAVVLVAGFVVSSIISLVAFGSGGAWAETFEGYGAAILADCGFAALVLMISILFRSVAGTIVGVFLFMVLDTMLGWGLDALESISKVVDPSQMPASVQVALTVRPWLPSAAFGVWKGFAEHQEWSWQGFVSLGIITVVSLIVGERLFARMDVP